MRFVDRESVGNVRFHSSLISPEPLLHLTCSTKSICEIHHSILQRKHLALKYSYISDTVFEMCNAVRYILVSSFDVTVFIPAFSVSSHSQKGKLEISHGISDRCQKFTASFPVKLECFPLNVFNILKKAMWCNNA